MTGNDLRAELAAAFAELSGADRDLLIKLGARRSDIDFLIGAAGIRVRRPDLYEPDESGTAALITPVRVFSALNPESSDPHAYCRFGQIVDLIGWHPARPGDWALRRG